MLEIDSDNERVFYYRGIAHLLKGEFSDAVVDLSTSITSNHERGAAFFARGLAHADFSENSAKLLSDLPIGRWRDIADEGIGTTEG